MNPLRAPACQGCSKVSPGHSKPETRRPKTLKSEARRPKAEIRSLKPKTDPLRRSDCAARTNPNAWEWGNRITRGRKVPSGNRLTEKWGDKNTRRNPIFLSALRPRSLPLALKSATRRPKEGRGPKSEKRNPRPSAVRICFGLRPSDFGLLSAFDLRPSDFRPRRPPT